MANRIALILCLMLFCVIAAASAQETITVTTYYPSPMGSYYELQTQRLGVGDVDNDGNFTSADVAGVDGGAAILGPVGIGENMIPSGAANETTVAIRSPASAGAAFAFTVQNVANQALLYVRDDGNVGVGTLAPTNTLTVNGTTWCSSGAWSGSDLRWKENVKTLTNPIDKILRLRGIEYEWKRKEFKENHFPEGKQIGLIAQEMEKEFPELVSTNEEGYKAIAYDRFAAVLLEAIKAQQKEIDSLKSEIAGLKAR